MRTVGLLAAAGAALTALGLLLPVWPAVTVSAHGSTTAVLQENAFTISYIHSIDGLPIEEDLRRSEGELVVERTRLRQFGAGMGHIEGQGQGRSEGEWWVLDDLQRQIGPQMHLRAGAPAIDHRLRAGETELRLSRCLSGERITISAERVSALTYALTRDQFGCAEPRAHTKDD